MMHQHHPKHDLFKSLKLEGLLQTFSHPKNRLQDLPGNSQIRYKTCLQDILYGPEHLKVAIEPLDPRLFAQSLDIKAGPIAGFDSSIVLAPPPSTAKDKEDAIAVGTTTTKKSLSNAGLKRTKKLEDLPKAKRIIPQTITHF